jgi:hypothetical protein
LLQSASHFAGVSGVGAGQSHGPQLQFEAPAGQAQPQSHDDVSPAHITATTHALWHLLGPLA